MRRWFLALLVLGVVMAMIVPMRALAQDEADQELNQEVVAIFREMHELRKQLVDKYVEAGQLTPEQGAEFKERMDAQLAEREEQGVEAFGFGPGFCHGLGARRGGLGLVKGMMRRFGQGF